MNSPNPIIYNLSRDQVSPWQPITSVSPRQLNLPQVKIALLWAANRPCGKLMKYAYCTIIVSLSFKCRNVIKITSNQAET